MWVAACCLTHDLPLATEPQGLRGLPAASRAAHPRHGMTPRTHCADFRGWLSENRRYRRGAGLSGWRLPVAASQTGLTTSGRSVTVSACRPGAPRIRSVRDPAVHEEAPRRHRPQAHRRAGPGARCRGLVREPAVGREPAIGDVLAVLIGDCARGSSWPEPAGPRRRGLPGDAAVRRNAPADRPAAAGNTGTGCSVKPPCTCLAGDCRGPAAVRARPPWSAPDGTC
jgi:hypothetical protein